MRSIQMAILLLAAQAATTFRAQSVQPIASQPTSQPSTMPAASFQPSGFRRPPAGIATSRLTLPELIKYLPLAGDESRFDCEVGHTVEHWASAELGERLRLGDLNAGDIGAALIQTRALRGRITWFADVPYAVYFRAPAWLIGHETVELTARAKLQNVVTLRAWANGGMCGEGANAQEETESYQRIGALDAGTRFVEFELVVDGREFKGRDHQPMSQPRWEGTVKLPVLVAASKAPAPDPSPDTTRALKAALEIHVVWSDSRSGFLDGRLHREPGGPLEDISTSVMVELMQGATKLWTVQLHDHDEDPTQEDFCGRELSLPDPAVVKECRLHVRGVEGTNRWCRGKYWAGEFDVPLQDVLCEFHP